MTEQRETAPAVGQRLRCEQCGTEIIVITAPGSPEVTCCGGPLTVIFARRQ